MFFSAIGLEEVIQEANLPGFTNPVGYMNSV